MPVTMSDCFMLLMLYPPCVAELTHVTLNMNRATAVLESLRYFTACEMVYVLTEAEHASNVLPWFRVAEMTGCKIRYIPLDEKGRLLPENLRKTISKNTKIVSVAHVTNVLGFVVIPAVGIRGFFRVIIRDGLDDRVWFKGRGSVV